MGATRRPFLSVQWERRERDRLQPAIGKLNPKTVAGAQAPGHYSDGGNLYLAVKKGRQILDPLELPTDQLRS